MKKTPFNPQPEVNKITNFINSILKKNNFKKIVIAISGGVDSATVLNLAVKALGKDNVLVARLPYNKLQADDDASLTLDQLSIPTKNIIEVDIQPMADLLFEPRQGGARTNVNVTSRLAGARSKSKEIYRNKIRLGNIMSRVRMTLLYDLAKANQALVCGTENKTEYLLGYYTLHGDSASDLEPIRHLYKTQVIELAKYLNIPRQIIDKPATAGLWLNQTDEKELGFLYKDADEILDYYFEKKYSLAQIGKLGFKKEIINKIIQRVNNFSYKTKLPYSL